MNPLPLTMSVGHYDHTRDLTDGTVPVEGVDLRVIHLPIEETFYRFVFYREWDVSEMSMGKYISMRSQDDTSITALPVFVSRMFRHSMFYVREGSALRRLEDLRGSGSAFPSGADRGRVWARHPHRSCRARAEGYRVDPGRRQSAGPGREGQAQAARRRALPVGAGPIAQSDADGRRHRRDHVPRVRPKGSAMASCA